MRRVMSLTDAVKQAATRDASLTDAVKEAACEGLGSKTGRTVAGSPGSALHGGHDGSQGGRHPWGPAPAPDSRPGRRSRLEREPDLREPELSRTSTESPARFDPIARLRRVPRLPRMPRIVRLPRIRLADPVLRLMSTGVRLAGIALLSFVSLVATPTVMGPDRPVVTALRKRVGLVIGHSAYRHARRLEKRR